MWSLHTEPLKTCSGMEPFQNLNPVTISLLNDDLATAPSTPKITCRLSKMATANVTDIATIFLKI